MSDAYLDTPLASDMAPLANEDEQIHLATRCLVRELPDSNPDRIQLDLTRRANNGSVLGAMQM